MTAEKTCESGKGCRHYAVFSTRRGPQLQRIDSGCLFTHTSDDSAATAFVRDLEAGNDWARRCAQELLDQGELE